MTSSALNPAQASVLQALEDAGGPLTAYQLLGQLSGEGLRAPPQVYRALEKLRKLGHVHRLETLNAFVACRAKCCEGRGAVAFAICDDCRAVEELDDQAMDAALGGITQRSGFQLTRYTVELNGRCHSCSLRPSAAD